MVAHGGDDRHPKGDVGKQSFLNEARSAERKKLTSELTVSNVHGPTVIDACGLCLGDNLSTEAGGVIRSHDALFDHILVFESTNSLCTAISREFSCNFLKFGSSAPCEKVCFPGK